MEPKLRLLVVLISFCWSFAVVRVPVSRSRCSKLGAGATMRIPAVDLRKMSQHSIHFKLEEGRVERKLGAAVR
jgi:hypothetical protein